MYAQLEGHDFLGFVASNLSSKCSVDMESVVTSFQIPYCIVFPRASEHGKSSELGIQFTSSCSDGHSPNAGRNSGDSA